MIENEETHRTENSDTISDETQNTTTYQSPIFRQSLYETLPVYSNNADPKRPNKGIKYFLLGFVLVFITISVIIAVTRDHQVLKVSEGIKLFEAGKYSEANTYLDKYLKKYQDSFDVFLYKGKSFLALKKYYEALACFKKAEALKSYSPKSYTDLYFDMGQCFYEIEKYNDSLDCFDKVIVADSNHSKAYAWKAYNLVETENYEDAITLCDESVSKSKREKDNAFAYNIKGLANLNTYKYEEALELFNKAIALDPKYKEARINKLSALFYSGMYSDCLNYATELEKNFPSDEDVVWYKADCYAYQSDHNNAISYYNKVLKTNPNNDTATASEGWEYFDLQNYDKAIEYADKALTINPDNQTASELKKSAEREKLPEAERIIDFVTENYLYINKIKDFDKKANLLKSKKNITTKDIETFIQSVKLKDDRFSCVISGKEYDYLQEEETLSQIYSTTLADSINYIRVYSFTSGTADEFKSAVENIENPESQVLILDLRDNGGGLETAVKAMLDLLLPECTSFYVVYRDGEIKTHYSYEDQIKFKKIYVLVNENTASSSELVTLGLKQYLNNVTVIGHPTVGKGVGQKVYDNASKKYTVFLVNFYWNVKERNIQGAKIIPDVTIKGSKDKDYFAPIIKEVPAKSK